MQASELAAGLCSLPAPCPHLSQGRPRPPPARSLTVTSLPQALGEPLYRVSTGNYEYRLILRCRQEARARFSQMRKDVLEKVELLDQKHGEGRRWAPGASGARPGPALYRPPGWGRGAGAAGLSPSQSRENRGLDR